MVLAAVATALCRIKVRESAVRVLCGRLVMRLGKVDRERRLRARHRVRVESVDDRRILRHDELIIVEIAEAALLAINEQ